MMNGCAFTGAIYSFRFRRLGLNAFFSTIRVKEYGGLPGSKAHLDVIATASITAIAAVFPGSFK